MDPQHSKNKKHSKTLFTELIYLIDKSGNTSKKKHQLKTFTKDVFEWDCCEQKMELYDLQKMEISFIISREHYKREAARLRLKTGIMTFVIPIVGYSIASNIHHIYTTWIKPDEIIPNSYGLMMMETHVFQIALGFLVLGIIARFTIMKLLYAIQDKVINLYENFKKMITREKRQVHSNEILDQQFKIIDLLLEDDPPIWNHQEALDQLNRKYLILALTPLLMFLLVIAIINFIIFFRLLANIGSDHFSLLLVSFFLTFLMFASYPFCFGYDQFCNDIERIFFAENSEE